MKKTAILLLAFCLALTGSAGLAQRLTMDSAALAYDYPDGWLLLSPQLCQVYRPLLVQRGLDADALAEEMRAEGVLSRALSEDGKQAYAVLTLQDALAEEIFDMPKASDAQRRSLKSRAEANGLWERTGLRTQDAEWQNIDGRYWLYIHYAVVLQDAVLARGLRYVTIHNGVFVALDWRIEGRRFTNRDLSAFRAKLGDLAFLRDLPEPRRTVKLACDLPTETNQTEGVITGTTTPGASLTLEMENDEVTRRVIGAATSTDGSFTLAYGIAREGTYTLTLTAEAEGMDAHVLTGTLTYSEKTIPVSGIAEEIASTGDTVTIAGKTLPSASLQLIAPRGLTKKRAGSDGSFSFELTTKEAGTYEYTLLIDVKGYTQRRLHFTVTRQTTEQEAQNKLRSQAVRIAYRELQRNLPKNEGALLNLYGPIVETSEGGGTYYARMLFTKDASGKWSNPVVIVASEPIGVKAGDMLSCTVRVDGVYIEQNDAGEDVAVPRLALQFVQKIE